ncbi:hypothetical protein HRH25_07630 [Flavisolibacter sp. BT320]|nr:hypothetical protein [Flavisolibacter longurius]
MKLLLMLFACVCLNKPEPTCKEAKETKKPQEVKGPQKQQKATFNKLAPSIIIINY